MPDCPFFLVSLDTGHVFVVGDDLPLGATGVSPERIRRVRAEDS
jgi:hypothetical protein